MFECLRLMDRGDDGPADLGVYEAIKALLMDQRLEPGSRINIDRLARDLHVSATPVREALARLEFDALVVKQPLRGSISAPLIDPASFAQLFELRLLIEPFAAHRAAILGKHADFDLLEELVAAMRSGKTGESYAEYRSFAQHDAKFHATIALASGNVLLHDTDPITYPRPSQSALFPCRPRRRGEQMIDLHSISDKELFMSNARPRMLVTGANGKLGHRVVELLLDACASESGAKSVETVRVEIAIDAG